MTVKNTYLLIPKVTHKYKALNSLFPFFFTYTHVACIHTPMNSIIKYIELLYKKQQQQQQHKYIAKLRYIVYITY